MWCANNFQLLLKGEAGMDPQLNGRRQERTVANRARRKKPRLSCHRARFVFDHVYLRTERKANTERDGFN
uniref:Uncharacterized protein n=1 Tax=Oryza rufipogon TaxID=4529 RepID=A0A0E0NRV2_ORYRU